MQRKEALTAIVRAFRILLRNLERSLARSRPVLRSFILEHAMDGALLAP
jgi:hypothetical protein